MLVYECGCTDPCVSYNGIIAELQVHPCRRCITEASTPICTYGSLHTSGAGLPVKCYTSKARIGKYMPLFQSLIKNEKTGDGGHTSILPTNPYYYL